MFINLLRRALVIGPPCSFQNPFSTRRVDIKPGTRRPDNGRSERISLRKPLPRTRLNLLCLNYWPDTLSSSGVSSLDD
jgi:hypothetical protein